MGTVGGGPMIGNNRSTSTPNGEETKVHEHQTMVLWIGGRVEILVGFSNGWHGVGGPLIYLFRVCCQAIVPNSLFLFLRV